MKMGTFSTITMKTTERVTQVTLKFGLFQGASLSLALVLQLKWLGLGSGFGSSAPVLVLQLDWLGSVPSNLGGTVSTPNMAKIISGQS